RWRASMEGVTIPKQNTRQQMSAAARLFRVQYAMKQGTSRATPNAAGIPYRGKYALWECMNRRITTRGTQQRPAAKILSALLKPGCQDVYDRFEVPFSRTSKIAATANMPASGTQISA